MEQTNRQPKAFAENNTLLTLNDLSTYFSVRGQVIKAVDGLSLHLRRGEIFGLVGESGSGKTMTALSIMRLVPRPGRIVGGTIMFEGNDLTALPLEEMQEIRGGRIGMIFQEPLTSLNPVLRIGEQISEGLIVHKRLSVQEAGKVAVNLLEKVGFDKPEKRVLQYPHQLSGGQRQRVLIAMAISCHPSLLIADEPTTALDVTIEYQILRLLQALIAEFRMSMLFITHNLNIIKRIGDRVGIMYAGRLVEESRAEQFFNAPLHPYSKGLLESMPQFSRDCRRLTAIPGSVPRLSEIPEGCRFHPRCARAFTLCREEEPPMFSQGEGRWVRCFLYQT